MKYQQLSIFEEPSKPELNCFHRNLKKSGFNYQEIDIGDITFKGGQTELVHRWYRLTPSYSPHLVRFFLKDLEVTQDNLVCDPFSGRGTTIIECQKKGVKAYGIELNPLLQTVGNYSLSWKIDHLELFTNYLKEIAEIIQTYDNQSLDLVIEQFNTRIPIIHNVFRWWKVTILKDLIIGREIICKKNYSSIYPYLWLAVNKAALDCANIHRNHPTITFDDHHTREIDVYAEIRKNLQIIADDLYNLNTNIRNHSELNSIILGDSTQSFKEIIPGSVDFIITSPPYPNRYSYVHQTRPQLYFMELLDTVQQATAIDLQSIGGTWGKATSILQNDLLEVPDEIKPYLSYYDELKEKSILMCNYATKYFIDLWQHIKHLKEIVSERFQGVYVVGNSRLSNVEIFTEVILSQLFEHEGFKVEKIISFRKRGGKKRLYETAICIKS
ncbi:site-specific DNA-methyltransferase [Crocosphaera sp. XPORK-15E]|uniref:site-specific DNA-methyltransferase n=1 Tax=Crocosphaera sp. XPORK-15E TaxID=3110247 RepID=UPI002B206174|nr:site-specific DNA-methyltransferase [Crocosphaera sp. XPORK-15E]MEA5533149.1 site-specific DNA-methyltransferase [Crocosphaera sp. XPORK-15E]